MMTDKLLEQMITGAPNFIGFVLAIGVLYRVILQQNKLISTLIDKWESCEDDAERVKLAKVD